MDSFDTLEVSSSGRPKLYPNEVTFMMESSARITGALDEKHFFGYGSQKNIPKMLDAGNVIITSHGIVYDNVSEHGHAFRLPYQRVVSVETVSKGIFSRTYKTILRLKPPQWSCTACTLLNNSTLLKCQACGTNRFEDVHVCYDPIDIKITLKAGDTRRITGAIEDAMGKKIFEKQPSNNQDTHMGRGPDPTAVKVPKFSTRSAGIAGIQRLQELKQRETKQKATEAFSDLDTLMNLAGDMVSLTEKYSDDLKQRLVKRGRIQLDSEEDSEDSDQKRFASIVNIMGISNPVTKDVAGSLFEEQLSRQIYDFIEKPLQDTPGSMMQLTDIYCMYNRARGTALISPDELVNACMLFKKLRLPLCLRSLESGVMVLQLKKDGVSDEIIDQDIGSTILEMMRAASVGTESEAYGGSITAVAYSTKQNLPLVLALGQLENAEKLGMLCRDEVMEQTTFYPTRAFDQCTL